MIGCFNPKEREHWKTTAITTDLEEAYELYLEAKGAFIDTRNIGGKEYHQVYEEYFSSKDETEAPLYNMIIDMEAVELHKLASEIWDKGGIVHHLNTDECSCSFPRDNEFPFEVIEKSINLAGYYYDKENKVPKYKVVEKEETREKKIERLPAHRRTETYKHVEANWTVTPDVEGNDFEPFVKQILESGKSWHIDGRAGTGKSTLIKKLMEEMDKQEIKYRALAPTNKACRVIKGQTIHRFASRCRTTEALDAMKLEYMFVDEI
jgi:hypothetical protein